MRLTDVLLVSHEGSAQIVDARPAARLTARPTNRARLRRGHIPGALNVPWTDLVINGELKTVDELNDIFYVRVSILNGRSSPAAARGDGGGGRARSPRLA